MILPTDICCLLFLRKSPFFKLFPCAQVFLIKFLSKLHLLNYVDTDGVVDGVVEKCSIKYLSNISRN